jgi:Protein of unknown function (DUF1592)/Protein of unknown function (DUF1588)/Protein of unknown function (DUF1585)/Protein of unknown function (DUF1595)/Protein of unknown function (DUF1587)
MSTISCTGILGSGGSSGDGVEGTPSSEDAAAPTAAGALELRRLSRSEYLSTARDLLGDTTVQPEQLPQENDEQAFPFLRPGLVDKFSAELFRDAAERLAKNAAPRLGELLPCDAQSAGEQECARQFVTTFGLKAYRRPLTPGEIETMMALYGRGRAELQLDFNGAIGLIIEAMLQSPGFLYHWESGPSPSERDGEAVKLDGYALANRLSYLLWGTMPDQPLFDAAAGGQLASDAAVAAEARRMLDDPRARDTVANFFEDWLDISSILGQSKDAAVYPQFDDALKSSMREEFRRFVNGIVFDGKGRFEDIFTETSSFVDPPLAELYGTTEPSGGGMQPVSLDPAERSGILTTAGFLAVTGAVEGSNPVRRGKVIYTRLLCGVLPPPPPDVPTPEPVSSGDTTRERFAAHTQQACAKGCHSLMDPLGFAFEHYDGIGQYRQTENGKPVDASGSVVLDSEERTFTDARELSLLLSQSDQVRSCFTKQWLRYALGRPESDEDEASLQEIEEAFADADYDVREMLVALVTSRTFRYRTPSTGEVLQ